MLGYHFTFVSRCNNCIAFTVLSEPIRGPVIKTTDNTLRLFASDTLANDISIVFTETPFTINEYVRPAALPSSKRFQLSVRPAAKTLVSGTILYWSHFDLNFSDWSRDVRRLRNHVHWKNLWLMVLEPTWQIQKDQNYCGQKLQSMQFLKLDFFLSLEIPPIF